MDVPARSAELQRTEFRLLKPMPSRQEPGSSDSVRTPRQEPWDTQIRRLFPPRDTPADEMPQVAGIQLGHFEIEERIARGGMGTVFRARDLRLDRVVALKVLSQEQLRDPAAVQRFQSEARAAAKLDHENIARVFFVGEDQGVHFIAFEYVRGTTVREAITSKGVLSQDEAVNYTLQAAEALRHTDAAGVIHRDIKPSNLIVTPSGRVKLVDLGLARHLDPNRDNDLTVSGTTLGTFDYISPEQARDPRSVDVRSDIYSLGCTLFHMLTGSPPYPHGTTVDKLVQHSTGRAPDPVELNPRISPRLSLIVQRMMAASPDERYATPQVLIDELSDLAESLGLRATAPEGTIWRRPLYRSGSPWWDENRGWLLAFGAIMLLALVGGDLYRWVQSVWSPDALVVARNDRGAPAAAPGTTPLPETNPGTGTATPATLPPAARVPESDIAASGPPNSGLPPATVTVSGSDVVTGSPASTGAVNPGLPSNPPMTSDAEDLSAAEIARAVGERVPDLRSLLQATSTPPVMPVVTGSPDATPSEPGTPGGTQPPSRTPGPSSPMVSGLTAPFVLRGAEGADPVRYQTLEAACHAAKSGSVIEIDFDGPYVKPQKPALIHGKRLTIRPVGGKRPQLTFVPGDGLLGAADMHALEVVDGSLELYDVDLVMQVSNNTYAERWVFLSMIRPQKIDLQRVTMTLVNAGWRPGAMLERLMPINMPANMLPTAELQRETEVQIRDCLFRGGANFYVDRSLEPATVQMADSAVVIDGDFLRVEGADRADMESTARNDRALKFEFDHLTVVVSHSILHVWTEDVRDCPNVEIIASNSILDASYGDTPFALLEGHQDSDQLLQRAKWNGSWNVIAADLEHACVVRGLWPLSGDEWVYSLTNWQTLWQTGWDLSRESVVRRGILAWQPGDTFDSVHVQLSDLALRPMESTLEPRNPAAGSAGDNSDRGFRPSLSSLPPTLPDP